jgi:hypothetical protein
VLPRQYVRILQVCFLRGSVLPLFLVEPSLTRQCLLTLVRLEQSALESGHRLRPSTIRSEKAQRDVRRLTRQLAQKVIYA